MRSPSSRALLISVNLLLGLGLLSLSLNPLVSAAAAPRQGQEQATPVPQVLGPGSRISVFKSICDSIGQENTCDGRDTSLDGYSIAFNFYLGTTPGDTPDSVLNVTLEQGDGSQGRDTSGELVGTTYTVCEVPVAVPPPGSGGQPINLDALPRPDESSGGSNQYVDPRFPLCIVVELTGSGDAELKFLDVQSPPTPTPTATSTWTPTSTPTATPTWTPEATWTPTSTPTATSTSVPHTPTPTLTPTECPTYTPTPSVTTTPSPTATATATPPESELAATPQPTDTPVPTDTPAPTDTPQPTDTPVVPDTPQPADTPAPDGPAPQPLAMALLRGGVRVAQVPPDCPTAEPTNTTTPTPTATPVAPDTPTPTATPVAAPQVAITKSVDSPTASVGETVTFSVTVSNPGPVDLADSQVEDRVPEGLQFVSATAGGSYDATTRFIGWATGPIAIGGHVDLAYTATVVEASPSLNMACVDARDASRNEVGACDDATVHPAVPTATSTPTATAETTATSTASTTPTPASTSTGTPTPTATSTPGGAAPARSATATASATPAPSASISATTTPTATPTATPTPTSTPPAQAEEPISAVRIQVLSVAIQILEERAGAEESQPPVQLPAAAPP